VPPTNPFADLLESSTASATPTDLADDLDEVVLNSAAAANNPFLASLDAGVNGAVAADNSDPWSNQNAADGLYHRP